MSRMDFGPGGIDCDAVLRDVYLYLDDETNDDLRNRVRDHLAECPPCLRQYGLEQDVRSLVARCCGGDQAPPSLHERIRVRITEVSIDVSQSDYRTE
jgi:mycothiol system anti-sigma-R factor